MIDIPKRVNNLTKKWGTTDPFKLCKYLNIYVTYKELGEGTKGFFQKIKGIKVIVLNSSLEDFDLKFVCAHELGHILLHNNRDVKFFLDFSRYGRRDTYEREADEFACYLLRYELEEDPYLFKQIDTKYLDKLRGIF